jgi:hypothetical protein
MIRGGRVSRSRYLDSRTNVNGELCTGAGFRYHLVVSDKSGAVIGAWDGIEPPTPAQEAVFRSVDILSLSYLTQWTLSPLYCQFAVRRYAGDSGVISRKSEQF